MLLNKKKAYEYFRSKFIMKKTSQNWWAFDNPFDPDGDGKKKMAVHFGAELVKCWRTGYRARILEFVADYEGSSFAEARELVESKQEAYIDLELLNEVNIPMQISDVLMPHGYKPLLSGSGVMRDRAIAYLENRNFDIDSLDLLGFGYCDEAYKGTDAETKEEIAQQNYFGYIIIPFKTRGKLKYFIGRDYIGNFLRYKNPNKMQLGIGKADLFYNEDALSLYDEVSLSEGWADAATMGKAGIASLGWSLSTYQKGAIISSGIKRLVMLPDRGFYKKAVEQSLNFIDHMEVVIPNIDLILTENEKDVNDIGKKRTVELIKETEPMTYDEAVNIIMD